MKRVRHEHEPGDAQGSPASATAIEHMRPPMLRPPMMIREVGTPSDLANARTSSRTHCSSTGALSGNDRPARRYGKSTRATGNGAKAPASATSEG